MSVAKQNEVSARLTWRDLLELLPKVLWVILAFLVFAVARRPILDSLNSGEVSKLSFATLQIEFAKRDFSAAAGQVNDFKSSPPVELKSYADRIQAAGPKLVGAKGLWVADEKASRYLAERRALNALGVSFDLATNNVDANELLEATKEKMPYDFIITDLHRRKSDTVAECFPEISSDYQEAGCETIELVEVSYRDHPVPIIIYSADASVGVPRGALGGADSFGKLMSLVLDAVERRQLRSS